jgi:hypothetical protein
MEQPSSLETNTDSAWEEIPYLLCNPKVHYRVYNNLPLYTILEELSQVHVRLVAISVQ